MAAVRHLGFSKIWFLTIGTPWAADFLSLYQIWRKNVDRRRNYGPKFWFWVVRTPKRDWSSSRPPKGTSFAETALTCQIWCWSVHWCDLGACWRNQKKARKETYSGKLGVRPDHPRWRSNMWSCIPGGLREVVLSLKFRQNRVNRFRAVGGRNLPFPIPKASGLYNSLYYRTCRDTASNTERVKVFKLYRKKTAYSVSKVI